jgi:N-hydroxyarylamine O-acetyltransferase
MTDATDPTGFDLPAYLGRIEYTGGRTPSPATLAALHLAHATHIPFENLDILLGRPIRLDLASLQAKLVAGGRGGYCFEQNRLFAAALTALGFTVMPLAARVRLESNVVRPRTHMTLKVETEGGQWLADVGFGASGPLLPVRFNAGEAISQYAWTYRIVDEGGQWLLQSLRDGYWQDLYAFTGESQHAVDYELANFYTSTHPDSRFTQTLTAQRLAPDVRRILRNRTYIEDRGTSVVERTLANDDEVLSVLANVFGLRFPAGTRFRLRPETS